jgi:hypothetical protein
LENPRGSLITEIRDIKKPNYTLTRFSQTYTNPLFASSRYNIQIYQEDLPDPIYILAIYALDSTNRRNRIKFIP